MVNAGHVRSGTGPCEMVVMPSESTLSTLGGTSSLKWAVGDRIDLHGRLLNVSSSRHLRREAYRRAACDASA